MVESGQEEEEEWAEGLKTLALICTKTAVVKVATCAQN